MNGTLIISDVDLNLLNAQRLKLAEFLSFPLRELTQEQADALTGILAMLDEWSDWRALDAEA